MLAVKPRAYQRPFAHPHHNSARVPCTALRIDAETSVVFRSARGAFFRGAKDDIVTVIDSPALTVRIYTTTRGGFRTNW
jgi:hypothetical protein